MKGYIYAIRSHQTEQIYIGSTEQILCKRMSDHRKDYKKWLNRKFNYVTSFEIVKFPDAYIELIEEAEFESKQARWAREGHYQRNMECVNKNIAGRTQQEYQAEHKEDISEYHKEYYTEHKAEIDEKAKKYVLEHKTELNKKCDCECGGKFTHRQKSTHFKSKLHLEFLKNKTII